MSLIAHDISKTFSRNAEGEEAFCAVHTTALALQSGTITEVYGSSGSGKSTLLNMLAGLLAPDAGTVEFEGQDIYRLDDKRLSKLRSTCFGVIPQTPSILASFSVLENVMLPISLYGENSDAHERARMLLDALGIGALAQEMPSRLSGGEVRRIAIARAAICNPQVIFADEPTGNLDDENTYIVLSYLRTLADEGASVFLVTHDEAARAYADMSLHMEDGVLQ